jgi:hypothetical protein
MLNFAFRRANTGLKLKSLSSAAYQLSKPSLAFNFPMAKAAFSTKDLPLRM